MVILKVASILWMLAWFLICFKSMVRSVTNQGLDPFAGILTLGTVWFLVGVCPILIIRFGWSLIK